LRHDNTVNSNLDFCYKDLTLLIKGCDTR
jgi:hypothetical protein